MENQTQEVETDKGRIIKVRAVLRGTKCGYYGLRLGQERLIGHLREALDKIHVRNAIELKADVALGARDWRDRGGGGSALSRLGFGVGIGCWVLR